MDGKRLQIRLNPPKLGEHSKSLLNGLGYSDSEIDQLIINRVVQ